MVAVPVVLPWVQLVAALGAACSSARPSPPVCLPFLRSVKGSNRLLSSTSRNAMMIVMCHNWKRRSAAQIMISMFDHHSLHLRAVVSESMMRHRGKPSAWLPSANKQSAQSRPTPRASRWAMKHSVRWNGARPLVTVVTLPPGQPTRQGAAKSPSTTFGSRFLAPKHRSSSGAVQQALHRKRRRPRLPTKSSWLALPHIRYTTARARARVSPHCVQHATAERTENSHGGTRKLGGQFARVRR